MASDPKLQPVSLLPPSGYIFSCIANRFHVKKEEGFTLAHFGLVDSENILLDRFSCAFTEQMLLVQKDNLVQYMEKIADQIGPVQKPIPAWTPPPRNDRLNTVADIMNFSVVDFIHLSFGEDFGELCFWNYSQGTLGDKVASGQKAEIATWGVGMVRCSADLQRAFLDALYPH